MSTPKEIMKSPAFRYAEDVLSDKVMAPKTIKKQAGHFLDDLKRAEKGWKYTFDLGAGRLPVQFCEQFLLPTAGEYGSFKFLPWQEFVDCQAFGWVNRDTGYRRYREVLEMVPRGNGKTARNSGKMGHMSTKGADFGAENYFCGNNGKQAKRFYMDFYRQMRHSPVLKKRLRLTRAYTEYEPESVVVEALGNDADVLDGLRPYYVVKDELEGERNFEQINQLLRPMKKRKQPMMWYTGTAGTVLDGPMVYHYNYAKRSSTAIRRSTSARSSGICRSSLRSIRSCRTKIPNIGRWPIPRSARCWIWRICLTTGRAASAARKSWRTL
ncbi:MAG: hypothetical protein IJ337_02985 [Clostridia bacterium]|nr:hypothetical protein [Clostridia bacterium]